MFFLLSSLLSYSSSYAEDINKILLLNVSSYTQALKTVTQKVAHEREAVARQAVTPGNSQENPPTLPNVTQDKKKKKTLTLTPDVPVGFLSFGTQRLPPAMRGSLWPSYAGHCCLDWSDFRKLSMASSCRILPAFDLQSSTVRGSLWPFYVDRIHPSCLQRSWKLSVAFSHRVLNICKLGLIISL